MKLTREQALDLIKVLSHYQSLDATVSTVDVNVAGLCADLEDYVLNGEDEEETDDEEDEEDDDSSEEASGEEDAEEPDESEDDEGDEADDEGEEDDDEGDGDEEEALDVSAYVLGSDLHDLKVAKGKVISSSAGDPDDEVTLEFECTAGDNANICDLLVGGEAIGPITHARRKGTELHVAEDNSGERTWHRFGVARFPKGWADVLPLDELCEIE